MRLAQKNYTLACCGYFRGFLLRLNSRNKLKRLAFVAY